MLATAVLLSAWAVVCTTWILALLFASFATLPGVPNDFGNVAPLLRQVLVTCRALGLALLAPPCYGFFAVFPTRSPLDRRAPYLKWIGGAIRLMYALPALAGGPLRLPPPLESLVGADASQQSARYYDFVFLTLALASLAASYAVARDGKARRKIRVVFWGTIVGLTPALASYAAQIFAGTPAGSTRDIVIASALYVMPLSIACAVVRHNVFDVPALLRLSARYVLVQRGFTFLLSLVSIGLTLAFAGSTAPRDPVAVLDPVSLDGHAVPRDALPRRL